MTLAVIASRALAGLDAPADLPKESGRFDLPIALGILLASGQMALPELEPGRRKAADGDSAKTSTLDDLVVAGELSLTGALVPVAGTLALALSMAHGHGLPP